MRDLKQTCQTSANCAICSKFDFIAVFSANLVCVVIAYSIFYFIRKIFKKVRAGAGEMRGGHGGSQGGGAWSPNELGS